MKIDDYFVENYLIPGRIKDNFVFTDCSNDFLKLARKYLNTTGDVKSCCVNIDSSDIEILSKLLDKCELRIQKQLVAQEYVMDRVLIELFKNEPKFEKEYARAFNAYLALTRGDMSGLFSDFIIDDIQSFHKNIRPIEVSFITHDVDNNYLQGAINGYLSSRMPYCVKIFADRDLCTYYDLAGNIIQCPHDYLTLNANVKDYTCNTNTTEETIL